jgi:hypothetical protein
MSTETITELNPQPEIDEALRKWLADYIAAHPEHTTAVLARADYIGMSRRALDAYLSGRYFLPREEGGEGGNPASSRLEPAIRAFRSRVQSLDQHGNLGTFVETGTWKYLQHACDTAINENAIVVIYGLCGQPHNPYSVAFPVMWRLRPKLLHSRNRCSLNAT